MIGKVMYTGSEAIGDAFDSISEETPYYSVWLGKAIMASHNSEDVELGRRKLDRLITAMEASNNTDIVIIKFHPGADKSGYITDKTAVVATIIVRVVPLNYDGIEQTERLPNVQYKFMLDSILTGITEKLTPIEERLLALESTEPDEDEDGIIGHINKYSKLLDHPVVMGIVQKYLPGIMGEPVKPVMISGTPGQPQQQPQIVDQSGIESLNNSLDRLAQHCDLVPDLKALADYADSNPTMFKMVLGNLKTT
jgi:hypothetical protein